MVSILNNVFISSIPLLEVPHIYIQPYLTKIIITTSVVDNHSVTEWNCRLIVNRKLPRNIKENESENKLT